MISKEKIWSFNMSAIAVPPGIGGGGGIGVLMYDGQASAGFVLTGVRAKAVLVATGAAGLGVMCDSTVQISGAVNTDPGLDPAGVQPLVIQTNQVFVFDKAEANFLECNVMIPNNSVFYANVDVRLPRVSLAGDVLNVQLVFRYVPIDIATGR
jgi:hypothetical protein